MATTIRIPMALLTVQVSSGNAFWTAKSGANIDDAHIRFVDSGNGLATFWMITPQNIAATENWHLDIHHHADSGNGGNVMLNVSAFATSGGNTIDTAPTLVTSAETIATNTSGVMTVSQVSNGTALDSVVALSANQYLRVEVERIGGNASDTVNADWNLTSIDWVGDIE